MGLYSDHENNKKSQVVVETPEYIKQANLCMDAKSREDFINYIASHPKAGDLITGTGGARKVRWTSDSNQGKRGGSRVIYYFHNENMPIFLFTAYSKNTRENITSSEKNALKLVITSIIKAYGEVDYD
jgi:mRNA-degrading endonuclease RelE of RelBE toxin-antitoxin system